MEKKPWVYIASPYTKGDIGTNVLCQMRAWQQLFDMGCVPIAPLWSHFQHIHCPRPYEDWMAYDQQIISRCDALLRMTAEDASNGVIYRQYDSPGADREVAWALEMGKPVFYSIDELKVILRRE